MSFFKVALNVFKKQYFKILTLLVCGCVALSIGFMFEMVPENNPVMVSPPPIVDTSFAEPEVWSDNQSEFIYEPGTEPGTWVVVGFKQGYKLQTSYVNFPVKRSNGVIVGISEGAFLGNAVIKGVRIPYSYKFVGDNAFADCVNLKVANIGVKTDATAESGSLVINNNAFKNCINLQKVKLLGAVSGVEDSAFINCLNIKDVTIESKYVYNSLTNINAVGGLIKAFPVILTGGNADDGSNAYLQKFYTSSDVEISGTGYAQYKLKGQVLVANLDADGGRCETDIVEFLVDDPLTHVLPSVTRDNYLFLGWYAETEAGSKKYETLEGVNANISLKAKWTPVFYGINYYRDLEGEESEKLENFGQANYQYGKDDVVLKTSVTAVNGYEFVGWYVKDRLGNYLNKVDVIPSTTVPENKQEGLNIYARYVKLFNVNKDGFITGYNGDGWNVNRVTISDGMYGGTIINGIADGAFANMSGLREVILDCNVKKIGDNAFKDAGRLQSVKFTNKVINLTEIGSNAFMGCVQLNGFVVPYSVAILGENVFSGCGNLNKVTFNSNFITVLPRGTFYNCKNLTELTLPELTEIGAEAFYNNYKLSLNEELCNLNAIGANLTVIDDRAFGGCASLQNWTFTSKLNSLGEGVFENCRNLSEIVFEEGFAVNCIKNRMFYGCTALENVNLPEVVTHLGDCAFEGCESLTEIGITEACESIGAYAFKNTKISNFAIGKNVLFIGKGVFDGVKTLSMVTVVDKNGWWASSSDQVELTAVNELQFRTGNLIAMWFKQNANKNVCHKDIFVMDGNNIVDVTEFGASVTRVVVEKSVEGIGLGVLAKLENVSVLEFEDVNGWKLNSEPLTDLTIGETVTDITNLVNLNSEFAFVRKGIFVMDGDAIIGLTELGKEQVSIVVPNSVREIGENAFLGAHNLKNLYFNYSVYKIGVGAFADCVNLETIEFADGNYWQKNADGVLVDVNFTDASVIKNSLVNESECQYVRKNLFVVEGNKLVSLTSVGFVFDGTLIIPCVVEQICDNSCMEGNFTKLVIGNSVVQIGNKAFKDCFNLEQIDLNGADGLVTIGEEAFLNCAKLKTLAGGLKDVEQIGSWAFGNCAVTSVELGEKVSHVGGYAFSGSKVESVAVNTLVNVFTSEGLFSNCHNLKTVNLCENVTSLASDSFNSCISLTSINLNNVTFIGRGCFAYCESITEFVGLNKLKEIGELAFNGCVSVTKVELSEGLTKIGKNAFANCVKLTSIVIPSSVNRIEVGVFEGCERLFSVKFEDPLKWGLVKIYASGATFVKYNLDLTNPAVNASKFLQGADDGYLINRLQKHN